MARTHNVQTPGAVATPGDADDTPSTSLPAEDNQGSASDPTAPPEPVPPVESDTPKAKKAAGKPSREDYAKMRAADVDPTAITAPVLTLDGYVVPAPKDAK